MAGLGRQQRWWVVGWLLLMGSGCGPLGELAQSVQGPSEVVGRDKQWFLDTFGEPCAKEVSAVGGELWLYAQADDGVDLLECEAPGVRRSWGIFFMGTVCTAAKSLDRPPR